MLVLEQTKRKFSKSLDVIHLLATLQKANLITSSMMNSRQALLLKMQRARVVESEDLSESSDDINELLNTEDKDRQKTALEAARSELLKYCGQDQKELSNLDKALLKGFYTNDRVELGNPTVFASPNANFLRKSSRID